MKKKPAAPNFWFRFSYPLLALAALALGLLINWSDLSPRFKTMGGLVSYGRVPVRHGFVTVEDGLLSDNEIELLNARAGEIYKKSRVTVYVLLVKNSRGIPIESFAVEVFDQWRPGTAAEDNGLLFVIATEDRAARLEVGYGLEGDFTDLLTYRMLEAEAQNFRVGKWADIIQNILNKTAVVLHVEGPAMGTPFVAHGPRLSEFQRAKWWQKAIGFAAVIVIAWRVAGPVIWLLLVLLFLGRPSFIMISAAFPFLMMRAAGQFDNELWLLGAFIALGLLNFCMEKWGKYLPKLSGPRGTGLRGGSGAIGSWGGGSAGGGSFGGRSGGGGATFRW